MNEQEKLFIIDSSPPFFIRHSGELINWSKIPYHNLERKGDYHKKTHRKIHTDYEKYLNKVQKIGYNSVSIDELSRMVSFDFYPEILKNKIAKYQSGFSRLFLYIKQYNLKLFVTTDILFFNSWIEKKTGNKFSGMISFLIEAVEKLFKEFPEVDGVIFRMGESDGVDVKGDFISRLVVKTPEQLNLFIRLLLPVFEKNEKLMIFRTWTIGAYPIGDLIWNERTFKKAFKNISSDYFILSMKFGEGDFFRYLKLNLLFFMSGIKKIIELQTRREYEGFGKYPSFTGWDYQEFRDQLKDNPSIKGIYVWCQTGGWSQFRNFTFLKKTSFWNELNTFVTIKLFRENLSVEEAVRKYSGKMNWKALVKFLKLSDEVIKNLLYEPEFSKKELYFNRVRIPPLIHIIWDSVSVTDGIIRFYNAFSDDTEESVRTGFRMLSRIKRMGEISKKHNFPYDFDFHYDTLKIIAYCRKLIYSDHKREDCLYIDHLLEKYRNQYPKCYKFYINVTKQKKSLFTELLISLFVRKRKEYRFLDRFLFNSVTSVLFLLTYRVFKRNFPLFIGKSAMPLSSIFK